MKKTFISHSSKDKSIVKELADQLKAENIWFDLWDMDAGDTLSEKIEKGIDEAKNFLIILSQNSITSNWVRYELNMAIIKYLESEDYRIIVAKIDDVKVPLRLRPFLRIESNSNNIVEKIISELSGTNNKHDRHTFKRQFVNRSAEITALQDMFYDTSVKFISIVGFLGIGKLSLIKEGLKRIVSNAEVVEINLTRAFFGSRLTLELCSKAGILIPEDCVNDQELTTANILAIETLLASNKYILFNRFESILDDEAKPNQDFLNLMQHFKNVEVLSEFPFFLISTRWPNLKSIENGNTQILKLGSISDKHLSHILSSEVSRTDPGKKYSEESLLKVSGILHGYPLAAKLAAPIIVKHGIDFLLENALLINQLKIDIAENIVSKAILNDNEINILELLAIFEHPLRSVYINELLGIDENEFIIHIDNLASYNLIETNGDGLILHPLVNDFYLKLARNSQNFSEFSIKLSKISLNHLKETDSHSRDYVYWLTNACRMLLFSGQYVEAMSLRKDLIGELKDAAIKLYQKPDYPNSLIFCDEFLASKPDDIDILFTKARCLSRIGKPKQSIKILKDLISFETNKNRLAKYNYAIGRAYIENSQNNDETNYLEQAEEYLIISIGLNEHQSALQSMGELLFRKNDLVQATSFIKRKLNQSPKDPYALSIYADILWAMNKKTDALDKIMDALKQQPKNPNFIFRAGRFLLDSGELNSAYDYFSQAVKIDDTYFDARLSLTDVCLDLERLDEAEEHINYMKTKLKGNKLNILESINAMYHLKKGDLDSAEKLAEKLVTTNRNVVNIGLLAKIYIQKSIASTKKGLNTIAQIDKMKATQLINDGLQIENDNQALLKMQKLIENNINNQ